MPSVPGFQLGPLPGARREALWLGQNLPGADPWTGPQPTLPRVLAAMREARVIHLGTHGLSDPEQPERAFLALAPGEGSDGLLTLQRLVTADPGDQPPFVQAAPGLPAGQEWLDADLVTLSACQTALGQPTSDGIIGLARAFLSIGARTVVASLWSVDDDTTAELMEAFYTRWLAGDDPAVALQHASESVRARHDDPRLWAPFVVLGAGVHTEGEGGPPTRPGPLAQAS
jgi:CHAT domain-containing protein